MIAGVAQLLFDTGIHPARYVLRAWPVAMVPTFAIALTLMAASDLFQAETLFPKSQWDGLQQLAPGWMFLQVVLFAPIVETLLMGGILFVLTRILHRRLWVVLCSAAIWGVLHGLSAVVWGVCIFWTFIVLTCAFLAWRARSFAHAFLVTTAIHALNNAVAGFGLLLAP